MPGPCPQGYATQDAHESARCRDRGRCTGPGCRLRRPKWRDRVLEALQAGQAARATEAAS